MIALFNNPKFQVFMMLFSAAQAFDTSRHDESILACALMLCACFWMFRVWGGLRAQNEGREQS